jgi:hypothetical protein
MTHRSLIVAAILLAGCDKGAPTLSGTYTLRSVGGDTLPAASITGVAQTTLADTVVFIQELSPRQSPQAEHRYAVRSNSSGVVFANTFREQYHVENGVVTFTYECPMGADCIFQPHSGTFRGDTLVVTWSNPQYRTQVQVRLGR